LEVAYLQEIQEPRKDNGRYVSIDVGLNNLATITNNCNATPIIITGKKLKSINKYYNKQISHYRGIAKRMNGLDWTNKMNNLTIKRNNMIIDLIHKASKSVIEYALSCDANTIIIGNNKDWKRESKMSKKVNQSFIGIPHQEFINKMQNEWKVDCIDLTKYALAKDRANLTGTNLNDLLQHFHINVTTKVKLKGYGVII
jgi:putative transposase